MSSTAACIPKVQPWPKPANAPVSGALLPIRISLGAPAAGEELVGAVEVVLDAGAVEDAGEDEQEKLSNPITRITIKLRVSSQVNFLIEFFLLL